MTQYWTPGTDYGNGDVVEYEGNNYKIIQPHRSQSDWAPPITPALWGRIPAPYRNQHNEHNYDQQQNQQQNQQQQSYQPPSYQPPNQGQNQGYPTDQKVEPTHEEKKTSWFDLDDKRKKQFEVGGALAAGAALLGGGFALYKHHEKSEEQKKAQTWALTNWVNEARERTEQFHRNGPTGPATWVLTQGKNIPPGAIEVGKEESWTLYICRSFVEGELGKASPAFQKGAVIGYKHDEIHLDTYEVLLGNMSALRWVSAHGRLNVASLGFRPVEGGREDDGTPLYIAKALHKGVVHPGKASEKLDGAYIPYGGDEKNIKEYQILCYN